MLASYKRDWPSAGLYGNQLVPSTKSINVVKSKVWTQILNHWKGQRERSGICSTMNTDVVNTALVYQLPIKLQGLDPVP